MVKTDPGSTNIFNITLPEAYRCQIYHYNSRLSRLYLRVFKGPAATVPAFYLLFADVAYMDCPVNWGGADFHIASQADCIQLLLDKGLIGQAILQFPDAYASITDHVRLYIATAGERDAARFIAGSAAMLRDAPDI